MMAERKKECGGTNPAMINLPKIRKYCWLRSSLTGRIRVGPYSLCLVASAKTSLSTPSPLYPVAKKANLARISSSFRARSDSSFLLTFSRFSPLLVLPLGRFWSLEDIDGGGEVIWLELGHGELGRRQWQEQEAMGSARRQPWYLSGLADCNGHPHDQQ